MARRKDHTREQLRDMMIEEGHRHLATAGYVRFSAKEVARRIGYSFGTVHNVVGGHDDFMATLNTRTFVQWADGVERRLTGDVEDRIRELVRAYFSFARENPNLWTAIYDHRLPPGMTLSPEQSEMRGRLTSIIAVEVARAVPGMDAAEVPRLTRSLIATVHGHCDLAMSGSLALMGEDDPEGTALARVRDIIRVARTDSGEEG
jgi:AcrR family transcriptional regulator